MMKQTSHILNRVQGACLAVVLTAMPALAAGPADGEPVAAGEYIARAGACMSCHGEDLSGGYVIE